jgi:hypothetical protein
MTTYYVDPTNGSDSNNGLGPDASHGSNKPFATIGKLIAASGSLASGDTAYLAPGVYKETVSVGITSYTVETKIIGDLKNSRGFKTSGGVLVPPGLVSWTAYTTNDKTAPSSTTLLNLNGRDFITFENIVFVQGNAVLITSATTTATDIKFNDCTFIAAYQGAGGNLFSLTVGFGVAANWLLDRCRILKGGSVAFNISLTTGSGSDYDANIVIKNCLIVGGGSTFVSVGTIGTSAQEGGGVDVINCTYIAGGIALATGSSRISLTHPCTIYNCFLYVGANAINAAESGAILEDYNIIIGGSSPRTNVSAGSNSKSDGSYAPLIHLGQELVGGQFLQPFGLPIASSPLLAFGDNGGAPTVDLLNRPRAAGGESTSKATGAYERHQTGKRETSTVRTGSNAIVITGPGDHDFLVPVDNTSTTITVYARYDSNHATTNKPQMKVLNGEEIGVSEATATMTAAVDTWEQLSLNFTPTAKGVVTVRFISRSAAGNGKAFFDDFSY